MSRTPQLRGPARLTRRTTVGAALAGVTALAGCDLGGDPGSGDPAGKPVPGSGSDVPDAGVVEAVLEDIVATAALVETLRRRHGSLRRPLAGLVRVHDAHLTALGGEAREPAARRAPAPPKAAAALVQLEKRELRHQRLLADRALSAQSGRLARLLASMSAAVAQQLAALPEGAGR